MDRTKKDSEKSRKILAAAVNLFSRTHDVKKVSIEGIAAEAGVSPTTIYNNFHDRDTLVYEVVMELSKAIIERNSAIVRSDLPFPQKITGIINRKLGMAEKVNSEIIEKMIGQDRKITSFYDEIYEKEIKPLWYEILADGKKEGYIDPSLDPAAFIVYLDILQAGARARPEIFHDLKENMDTIKQLARLMFYGFMIKDIDLFRKEEK